METNDQSDVDISDFCRLCLQLPSESQVLDLNMIYDEEEQLTYHDCFTICTQIDLRADTSMPHNLCKSCGLELQVAYDFHKKVESSKRFLSQMKEQQATEEVADEEQVLMEHHHDQEPDIIVESNDVTSVVNVPLEPLDAAVECEELEEHLEIDEYTTVETLDEDDAETVHNKSNPSCVEELLIETVTLTDSENEQSRAEFISEKSETEQTVVSFHNPEDNEHSLGESITSSTNEPTSGNDHATSHSTQPQMVPKRLHYPGEYDCDYCQKRFPNHSRMRAHRRSHEPDRPKFPCHECGRMYATKQAKDVHVRSTHIKTGYSCQVCGKIYAIKKGLEVHMRYHTGDFPYVCDLCGRKYAQVCHLNTHKNVKHNSVRFSCEHPNCGKVFTSSASLRCHEFTHSAMPFECEFCGFGYPAKSKLKVHIRRKHGKEMSIEELESMRKFHVMRSKLSLVKLEQ